MKNCGLLASLVAAALMVGCGSAAAPLRVGTYDSRAVAVAFAASATFNQELRQWKEERDKAEAAGDDKTLKQLEAKAVARQKQAHHQGFGAAPVDDIIEHIKDKLPAIAQQADVDVIVSKWAVAYCADGAKFVDVTDLMVEPFAPNERTQRIIRDLRDRPLVSPDEIDRHQH
ncbi:MAG: hypothetical protein JW809_19160 [Pirellulales bacterium]|nr:hypothetical protein [Pirellulales bacterium]